MAANLQPASVRQPGAGQGINAPESVEIVSTGKALGAEVRGMDLSQPVPEATKRKLSDAWAEHLVLLWRDQKLPDESFLQAAEIFGETKEGASRKYQVAGGYQVGGKRVALNPRVSLISNLDERGEPVLDNGTLGSYEVVWHSDNSYVEVPPAGSMLYAVIIPTDGGGDTFFNNQYRAYEELSEDLKRAIEGKSQLHGASRNSTGMLRPTVKRAGHTGRSARAHLSPRSRPSGHRQEGALSRSAPRLAVELHPRHAERRERATARQALGARHAGQIRLGPQVARGRSGPLGQSLRDALPLRGRREAGAGSVAHRDQGRAGDCRLIAGSVRTSAWAAGKRLPGGG